MPPRVLAALSLVAAIALTGANVALATRSPRQSPSTFSCSTALLWQAEPRPPWPHCAAGPARPGRLHGADAGGHKRTAAADAGIITATLPAVVAARGVLFAGKRLSAAVCGPRPDGSRPAASYPMHAQGGNTTLLGTCWSPGRSCARRASSFSASGSHRHPAGRPQSLRSASRIKARRLSQEPQKQGMRRRAMINQSPYTARSRLRSWQPRRG